MQESMTRQPFRRTVAVLPAGIALVLAACSLGPDYQPPTLDVPAAWRTPATTRAASTVSATWWKGFRSAELDALIDDTLAASFDIQAAVARVRQADAQLTSAGATLLPTLGATASDAWTRGAVTQRTATGRTAAVYTETRAYTLGPTASWEIDFWGQLRATRDAAAAAALGSRFDRQTVVLTTVTSVANTWFQALALQDRLNVADRNLSDSEEILAAIRARQDAGTASLLDVSQQAALVAGLRAQVPALRSQLEQQINALGVLIGRPPSAITVRPGTLNALALPEIAPGLPSSLLARRPDVASAEAQLIAANANIRAARAAFFPQVTLSGSAGWQNLALATLFGPGSLFAAATVSATQTIFDNGAKGAALEQARGRYDELLADYRKAVVQAFTDVENGVVAYQLATDQEALERDAVTTAQQAADIARAQVMAGTSDMVTALQAQTTLYTDLDLLAQVRLARFQALLNLYKALGGGWSRDEVTPPEAPLFQGVL
jgi:multidrug efflux system outer membrane protein